MNQFDNLQADTVTAIIGGQIIAHQAAVIAKEEIFFNRTAKPWVALRLDLPEMKMSVDYFKVHHCLYFLVVSMFGH
jgi:hypothetical protein